MSKVVILKIILKESWVLEKFYYQDVIMVSPYSIYIKLSSYHVRIYDEKSCSYGSQSKLSVIFFIITFLDHNRIYLFWPITFKKNQSVLNPLSANTAKSSNTLKQFFGNLGTNCLNVLDHFVGWHWRHTASRNLRLKCTTFPELLVLSKKLTKGTKHEIFLN